MNRRPIDPKLLEDLVLNEVVERFLKSPTSTKEIADEINAIYDAGLTREQIYPELRKAVRRKLLVHAPNRDRMQEQQLRTRANRAVARGAREGEIAVVNAIGALASESVPVTAANLVLTLVKELGQQRKGKPVHIGIGIGWSTMRFCKQLGALLRDDTEAPPLEVHALATAYSFWSPLETPIAGFAFLSDAYRPIEGFHGLFAQPYEREEDYDRLLKRKEVKKAFERKDEIDIVITSLASRTEGCQHGYLYKYLLEHEPSMIPVLEQRGWIGDVQLRPYSAQGPMLFDDQMIKPVTLFDLDELACKVQSSKHVVLLCAPCGRCYSSKAQALAPLLEEPSLRVWSHLVIDYGTAFHLITGDEHPAAVRLKAIDAKGKEHGREGTGKKSGKRK